MTKLCANATMVAAADVAEQARLAVIHRQVKQLMAQAIAKGGRTDSFNRAQRQMIIKFGDDLYVRNECILDEIDELEATDLIGWRDIGVLLIDEPDPRRHSPRVLRHFAQNAPCVWMAQETRCMAIRIEQGQPAHVTVPKASKAPKAKKPRLREKVIAPHLGLGSVPHEKELSQAA